jgi:hypothetical protein
LHAVGGGLVCMKQTHHLRTAKQHFQKRFVLSLCGVLLSTSLHAALLDFETGYSIGDSGATLQSRNAAFIGTMPEGANIFNSGISGFGSFSLRIGQSSTGYLPIFSDNAPDITSFAASVDFRPGSTYTDTSAAFGSDGSVSWQTANNDGTPQQLSSFGLYFYGNGGGNISQVQKIHFNLLGGVQNTGISYSSSLIYTISMSVDYNSSLASLSLDQGGSTLFSTNASIVGSSFQNTKKFDTIVTFGNGDFGGGGSIPVYDNINTEAVPEPSTSALLILSFATVVLWRIRRRI